METPDESATEIERVSEPPTAGPATSVRRRSLTGDARRHRRPGGVGAMIGLTRQLAASEPQVEPDPEPAPREEPPAAIAPEAPDPPAPETSPVEDRGIPNLS